MTYRPPTCSASVRVAALFDAGDTRTDTELAEALGVKLRTIQSYRQKWNREHGQQNRRAISNEAVTVILGLRNDGLGWAEITRQMRQDGYQIDARAVQKYYDEHSRLGDIVAAHVSEDNLPLATVGGMCWMVPRPWKGKCENCGWLPLCEALEPLGWALLPCEMPVEWEVEVAANA